MTGRRRETSRAASRRAESTDPTSDGPVARQTRGSARRAEPSLEPEPRHQTEIARRGTRRGTRRGRRRKSLESIATTDFPKSSGEYANPEPESERTPLAAVSESAEPRDRDTASPTMEEPDQDSLEVKAALTQDMVDFDIPKFSRWCDNTYRALTAATDPEASPEEQRKLALARRGFNVARQPFADDSELFIRSFQLPGDQDPEVGAKVRVALRSGNLVSLLDYVLDVEQGKQDMLTILEQLDDGFPVLFSAHSDCIEDTFDLAYKIRCRRLVEMLATDHTTDSLILATRIFCEQPAKTKKKALEALSQGPYRQLAAIDIDEDVGSNETYQTRMEELSSLVLSDESPESRGSLGEAYPEDSLLRDLTSWAREMFEHLNNPSRKGITATHSPKENQPNPESESLFVPDNDNAREYSEVDSASDSESGTYDKLPPQDSGEMFIDDLDTLAAARQSERRASERPTPISPSSRQSGKGKHKPSANVEAIRRLDPWQILSSSHPRRPESSFNSHEDPQGSTSNPRSTLVSRGSVTRKRSQPGEDDGNGDDFEFNDQPVDKLRRAQYGSGTVRRPSPKRSRFASRPPSRPLGEGDTPFSPAKAGPPSIADERLLEDHASVNRTIQDQDLLKLSQSARQNRQVNGSGKPTQVRTRWSAFDTQCLLNLIADPNLNCSWSAMEKQGGFEKYRDQQALRDKARNLKVLYLQGDKVLPAGFDRVVLGTKEKNAVKNSGRNPDRTEHDEDAHGEVINNIWIGN
ncbi:Uu.00g112980.m01.CDS01 [Anthostomella pinea]|uniref:Uu.00g112980.m01.CDS01 n=1 Tax=Anthostomella pinea TaxID=933095 RepID=A0AAI8VFB8_9PEZI|nr:Uu.00g112980.m01.CDS01 [Anthostomella pinea]